MDEIQKRILQDRFAKQEANEDYKMQRKLERNLMSDGRIAFLENDLFSWFRKKLVEDGNNMGIRNSILLYKAMRYGINE